MALTHTERHWVVGTVPRSPEQRAVYAPCGAMLRYESIRLRLWATMNDSTLSDEHVTCPDCRARIARERESQRRAAEQLSLRGVR